jgi:hypothetical protein
MVMRMTVNGREVTNPAVRAMAMVVVMAVVAFMMTLLMFVALPLLGIAVGTMLGLAAVGAGSLLVGLPLALRARNAAQRLGGVRAGNLSDRAWRDAEDTEYTIEDVPPGTSSSTTTDGNTNKDQ